MSHPAAQQPPPHAARARLASLVLLLAAPTLALAQGSSGGPPFSIQLDDIHPDPSTTVSFSVADPSPLPYDSIHGLELQDAKNANADYRVEMDLSTLGRDKYNRFGFTLYVNQARQFNKTVYAFDVHEDPTGNFNDTIGDVNIRLTSTGKPLIGTVTVPLHSLYGSPTALVYSDWKSVQSVRMGTETDFTVHLVSGLSLAANLGDPTAVATCDKCVQSTAPSLSKNRMFPNDPVDVTFHVIPNTLKAMSSSAHHSGVDYDADLNLSIPVTADQGGIQHPQQITVHIRFAPSRMFMALVVILGTLAGAAVRALLVYFADSDAQKKWKWAEFATGAIYAVVIWLLAIALFSGGHTNIEFMGIRFDPTQLFSAGLLTFLAGAGPVFLKGLDNSILGKISGGKE